MALKLVPGCHLILPDLVPGSLSFLVKDFSVQNKEDTERLLTFFLIIFFLKLREY